MRSKPCLLDTMCSYRFSKDAVDQSADAVATQIYDHSKIVAWDQQNVLKVVRTVKENGKFCIMRIMEDLDSHDFLIVYGSKNNHVVVTEAEFLAVPLALNENKIIRNIQQQIVTSYSAIKVIHLFISLRCFVPRVN